MRSPVVHELKSHDDIFPSVIAPEAYRKTFEIRKDDRDFQVGDNLLLREVHKEDPTVYTRREALVYVSHILRPDERGWVSEGIAIMSIRLMQHCLDRELSESCRKIANMA